MDQLELLKKTWKKDADSYQHLSSSEISPMLWKKSSSIAKKLFYISVGEIIFWTLMNFLPIFLSAERNEEINSMYGGDHILFNLITVLNMAFVVVFSYLLFKSYKAISIRDNVKNYMASILRTRRVIQYFVICNLVLMFFSFIITFYYAIHHVPELAARIDLADKGEITLIILKFAALVAVVIGIFWLVYRLIYGILIRRLLDNYRELKKVED